MNASEKPGVVRWGVLGAADIAVRRLIPAMHEARGNEVVALASRSHDRARALVSELNIPRAYGSYAELLADPEVDAVYVPLPNTMHAEWTIRSAEAGKHVLCEKPMATTVAECDAMIAACRAAGVKFMEAFMYRFHPQHARVRALVASGAIGEPTMIRSSFCVRMQRPPEDIRYSAALGGGALFDVGVYALDAARWLAATAQSEATSASLGISVDPVGITGQTALNAAGVDENAAAALAFPSGLLAAVTCSFQAAAGGTYEIIGPQGKITVHHAFTPPPDTAPRLTLTTPEGATDETFAPNQNQYTMMLEAVAQSILNNTPTPLADAAGRGNIAIIESLLSPASRTA
ncbi:MAG TPA: Gfo/Idh/MocA family oxidoreductase [Chloroflexota bacterium]|nr:Gfo/Idh/MocA family oxidoreductase [Chloroflexota bacterium]